MIIGLDKDQIIGKTISDLKNHIPVDLGHNYIRKDWDLLKKGGTQVYEGTVTCADGIRRCFVFHKSTFTDHNDKIAGIVGLMREVTRQREMEKELVLSDFRFKSLYESLSAGALLQSRDGGVIHANKFACKILGLTKEQMQDKSSLDNDWHLEDEYGNEVPGPEHPSMVTFKTGNSLRNQLRSVYSNDPARKKWLLINTEPFAFDEDGNVSQVLVTFIDVTERVNAQQKQAQLQSQYVELYQNLHDGVVSTDLQGNFKEFNEAYHQMLGYSRQELMQMNFRDITPIRWVKWEDDNIISDKVLRQGYSGFYEKEYIKKDGSILPVEISAYLKTDKNANPVGMWALVHDITNRKRAENKLKRLNATLKAKNEELQSFVYITSHDLRSPLVNIKGFSGELQKDSEQLFEIIENINVDDPQLKKRIDQLVREDITEDLHFITASAEKMEHQLHGLLKISRLGRLEIQPERVDMNEVVRNVLRLMNYEIGNTNANIKVQKLHDCMADASQITQVFTNLIGNAINYAKPGRDIKISVNSKKQNKEIVYSVADNGKGIDPEYIEQIFEMFNRLNPQDGPKGEGLGLTIVKRIISRHEGRVWAESTLDQGAAFYFTLPAAD
jgi:PAS domain S-box-containing protein